MSRTLNFVLGFGLLGAVVLSLVTPSIVSVLFTPPVSFGTNCEPAAVWSMEKMHASEATGLIGGMVVGLVLAIYLKKRKDSRIEGTTPAPTRA